MVRFPAVQVPYQPAHPGGNGGWHRRGYHIPLVTLSTGEKVTNPKHEQRDRALLVLAQRRLSRKAKGSENRAKARVKVARVHARITDRRRDMLHKLSTPARP